MGVPRRYFLGVHGVILGALWDPFGIIVVSFWGYVCATLDPIAQNVGGEMMTPARDPKQRENHEKSCFSLFFQRIFGQNQSEDLQKTRPIILNRSQPPPTLPDPFYIDFIFFNFFRKKKCLVFLSISYIFIIFSAPEAPGPVPNCRSHFSAQTRVIESF